VIPAFAIGRTQDVFMYLPEAAGQGFARKSRRWPVYVDQPDGVERDGFVI